MDSTARGLANLNQLARKIGDDVVAKFGGILRCEYCAREERLDGGYVATGWPKCCGYTMRWWTQRQLDAVSRGDACGCPCGDGSCAHCGRSGVTDDHKIRCHRATVADEETQ